MLELESARDADPAFAWLTKHGPWESVNRVYPSAEGAEAEPGYSEFCYFHPFVRNFLYITRGDVREDWNQSRKDAWEAIERRASDSEKGGAERDFRRELVKQATNRNLRILQREDLDQWIVEVGELTSRFQIKSCWLYLFDTQVAMLELQLKHDWTSQDGESVAMLNLRQVLTLQDVIRRIYSPYWSVFQPPWARDSVLHADQHVPGRVTLLKKAGAGDEVSSSFGNYQSCKASLDQVLSKPYGDRPDVDAMHTEAVRQHLDHVYVHREPFTVEVWRELLLPLRPTTLDLPPDDKAPSLRFEQIQDDRAMLMSHLAIGDVALDLPARHAAGSAHGAADSPR